MLGLAPLRVVLWSLLYCGALMSCGLACGTLCFVLMLCICSVSVLRWRDRYHAALFFVVALCCVVLRCVVLSCVVSCWRCISVTTWGPMLRCFVVIFCADLVWSGVAWS